MHGIASSFLRGGKRYFVPPTALRLCIDEQGIYNFAERQALISRYRAHIFDHWTPPDYMYQFRAGGHAAMVKRHVARSFFAHIDLKDFFEHVSDTKVYRALRRVGLSHHAAYRLAGESTVRYRGSTILPRGFHQSQLLASLVFDQSLVGSAIRRGGFSSLITCYSDDVIMSSNDVDALTDDFSGLMEIIERANFPINNEKTQGPNRFAVAFNIVIRKGSLEFTEARLSRFVESCRIFRDWCEETGRKFDPLYESLFGRYVASINLVQEAELRFALGLKNQRGKQRS